MKGIIAVSTIVGMTLLGNLHSHRLQAKRPNWIQRNILRPTADISPTWFQRTFYQNKNQNNSDLVYVKFTSASSEYNIRSKVVYKWWEVDQYLEGALKGKAHKIMEVSNKYGICPYFLTAIAMHESANGKSRLARSQNNVCGIYRKGGYAWFDSVDDCLEFTASRLAGSIYANCQTVGDIQKIYCPVGAANDVGTNFQWRSGVVMYMNKISGNQIPVKVENNIRA